MVTPTNAVNSERDEIEITRLNRLLRTLAAVNRLIVRETDRQQVLARVCQICVEQGGFRLATVLLVDADRPSLKLVAHHGQDGGYLDRATFRMDAPSRDSSPSVMAVRTGEHWVVEGATTSREMEPWRDEALRYGLRSFGAFPLRVQGEIVGCLTLHSDTVGLAERDELSLLDEVAGDVSFALDTIQRETRRGELEAALSSSETKFRELFDRMPSGAVVYEAIDDGQDFVIRDFNSGAQSMEGLARDEVAGRRVTEVFPGVREMGMLEGLRRVWQSGEAELIPLCHYSDGRIAGWRENHIYKLPSGEVVAVYSDRTQEKQAVDELREQFHHARELLTAIPVPVFFKDPDMVYKDCNPAFEESLGRPRDEIIGRTVYDLVPPDSAREYDKADREAMSSPGPQIQETTVAGPGGRRHLVIHKAKLTRLDGSLGGLVGVIFDVTEQKHMARELEVTAEILRLLNEHGEQLDVLRDIVISIKGFAGVDAVGLRLREGEDFPYYETSGFPSEFVALENSLCSRDQDGTSQVDPTGDGQLECMCGNVLQGRTDPSLPFFTDGGSFWTNSTTALLASTTPEDQQSNARNRCQGFGYESVALIPLRSGNATVGLLQLNDKRPGRFSHEFVQFLEGLGSTIGIALTRRHADEELRSRELRYRTFIDSTDDLVSLKDEKSRHVMVNQAYAKWLGRADDEVVGLTDDELLPAEMAQACRESDLVALASAGTVVGRETGSGRIYETRKFRVDLGGGRLGVGAYIRDITDWETAKDALRQNEELYRGIVQDQTEMICRSLPDGTITFVNGAYCRFFGFTSEELVGNSLFNMMSEDAREVVTRHVGSLTPLEPTITMEFSTSVPKDSWQRWTHRVFFDEAGRVVGAQATGTDITDRKLGEDRVQRSEELYRRIVQDQTEMICRSLPDGTITFANEQYGRFFGRSPEDLIGISTYSLMPEEVRPRVAEAVARLTPLQPTFEIEGPFTLADGSIGSSHWTQRALFGEDGRIAEIQAVGSDTTALKLSEQQHRMASVGQLAAGVAHDFNNLLAAMSLTAELVASSGRDPGRLVDVVRTCTHNGSEITKSLMVFARPDEPRRSVGRLETSMDAALSVAGRQLANADVNVVRQYAAAVRPMVFDASQMEQVFLNLIINACHAMPGGGTLTLSSDYPPSGSETGQAVLRFTDTGTGIDPMHLGRIFEPFFTTKGRLGDSDTPGSGLGLSVSYGLITAHGGTLAATSRLGSGTTFEIRLPLPVEVRPVVAAVEDTELAPEALAALSGARVLLAEDDRLLLGVVRDLLGLAGCHSTMVENAGDAIDALRQNEFDLILTDLMMPDGGAPAVLEFCRTMGDKAPPVIVMTGRLERALHDEVMALGAARMIEKPFGRKAMFRSFSEVLRSRGR